MTLKVAIKGNFSIILRCLEPSNELLGRLRLVSFVEDRIPSIKQQVTIDDKNDALLTVLLDIPDDLQESVMNNFIAALRSSGQDHVANIFHQESDKVPMSDQHYQLLNNKMQGICEFLEPRDGLINWLLSSGVFTSSNSTSVLYGKQHVSDMARRTIEILQRKSDDSFEQFISALHKTEQDHVAYMLTGIGKLPMSEEHRKLLQSKKEELEMFCDPENGVVSALTSARAITALEEARIRSITNLNGMARELVETLLKKSDNAFDAFIKAMNKTGQGHVTYILTGEGGSQPLSKKCRAKLMQKRSAVVKSIYPECIVTTLISKGVFSSYDQQRVKNQEMNENKMNEMIVDLIARKSQSDFNGFIATLKECHHEHVADELMGLEVVGEIQAQVGTREEMARADRVDVDELCVNMQRAFNSDDTEVKTISEVLSSNGISVTDIEHGSITVKFRCRDHVALASLEKFHTSKRLDQLFTEAFYPRFAERGLEALSLKIARTEFERHKEPMTDEHREKLLSSAEHIVEKLTVNDALLDKLSLCSRRRQTIERAATRQQQVKTLLDIVSRQPDFAFTQLLNALDATEQQDAASIISSGYKPASIHAEYGWKEIDELLLRIIMLSDPGSNHLDTLHELVKALHGIRRQQLVPTATSPFAKNVTSVLLNMLDNMATEYVTEPGNFLIFKCLAIFYFTIFTATASLRLYAAENRQS